MLTDREPGQILIIHIVGGRRTCIVIVYIPLAAFLCSAVTKSFCIFSFCSGVSPLVSRVYHSWLVAASPIVFEYVRVHSVVSSLNDSHHRV